MPFTTIQNDKSMDDLVDRLFNRLTDRQRVAAVKALHKANPKLKTGAELVPGTVLVVPASAAPRAKVSRTLDDADAAMLERIDEALQSYEEALAARRADRTEALQEALRQAEAGGLSGGASKNEDLARLIETALVRMKDEIDTADERQARLKARVAAARKDIRARL